MKNLGLKTALACMLIAVGGSATFAYDIEVDGIYYNLSEDSCAIVAYGDSAYADTLVIPSSFMVDEVEYKVIAVGDSAFKDCADLQVIVFPETLLSVGNDAFVGCTSLRSVSVNYPVISNWLAGITTLQEIVLGDDVKAIEAGAFKGCTGLMTINLPDGLTAIADETFDGCTSLAAIIIPETVATIGDNAFKGCTALESINLTENLTAISTSAFSGCTGLTTASISLPTVGTWFAGLTGLQEVKLDDEVKAIGDAAFKNCTALTTINLPEDLKTIGENAFNGCSSLASIVIPANATISTTAFKGCHGLKSATINAAEVQNWFAGLTGLQEVTLSDDVTSIVDGAFKNCTALTTINLPEDLKTIGENAFNGCSSLASIVIPANAAIPTTAFKGCNGLKSATINAAEVQNWFAGLTGLQEVMLSDDVTSIVDGAFKNCTALTTINLPEDLKTIGENAFNGCSALASIELPANATIPVSAFKYCSGLTSATINTSEVLTWFAGLTKLNEVKLADEVTSIADNAFKNCTALTTINLPEDLKTIGESAFYGCSSLASIVLPSNATVPTTAFKGCNGLTSATINTAEVLTWFAGLTKLNEVKLADEVTSIADGAFKNCTALTTINIPDDLKTIGENAFNGCSSLASIVLPANATVPTTAFKGCSGLTSAIINTPDVLAWFSNLTKLKDVTLGEEVRTIGKQAFYNCSGLTNVTFTEGLQEIGSWALGKCSKLSAISIPDGVTTIGDFAFEGCQSLSSVYINTEVVAPWFAGLTSVKKIELGDNVSEIEAGAFARMTSLQNVTLGNSVAKIDNTTIPSNAKIYTVIGGKSLLALWDAGYDRVYETGTSKLIQPTTLSFVSSTQTTASFLIDNIYPGYELSCEGKPQGSAQLMITDLCPESEGECILNVENEGVVYHATIPYTTQPLNVKVAEAEVSPTSFTAEGTYNEGDAVITSQRMTANKAFVDGGTGTFSGLDPQRSYTVKYTVTVAYGEDGKQTAEFVDSAFVFTSKIQLKTLGPKVISKGEVIVAAESNITNDEETVGFEWRRTDAPASVASKSGNAYLYEGTMEGFLHNLTSSNYWNYRPYYESASGKKYYGEWGTVEADDDSYFEPTVHTYAKIEIEGNEAEVKGYALRGTDEVEEQGFIYWETEDEVASMVKRFARRKSPSIPANARVVAATGQVMNARLTNLSYGTTYDYVAFVKTSKGETFYGEQQTFKTEGDLTAIEGIGPEQTVTPTEIVGRYDLQGRKLSKPVKGVNVLIMSDGSTRKVLVR